MFNQDQKMEKYTPDKVADKYYILDTTTPTNKAAYIPALNGRQGDKLRVVPLAFQDDGQPHDLTDTKITLKMLDSSSIVKVSDTIVDPMDPRGGLVMFGMPEKMYESAGEVQSAYFELTKKTPDGQEQQISTVFVDFYVIPDTVDISKAQSTTYLGKLDEILNHSTSYAALNADNHFVGSNVIDSAEIRNLDNPNLNELVADFPIVSNVASHANTTASTTSSAVASLVSNVTSLEATLTQTSSATSNATSSATSQYTDLSDAVSNNSQAINNLSDTVTSLSSSASLHIGSVAADLGDIRKNAADAIRTASSANSAVVQATSNAAEASMTASQLKYSTKEAYSMASVASYNASRVPDLADSMEAITKTNGIAQAAIRALRVANAAMSALESAAKTTSDSVLAQAVSSAETSLATDTSTMTIDINADYNEDISTNL